MIQNPNRRHFLIFYALQVAALSFVLIPFARFNNLLEWDFPGHYAGIWHIKTHLLPWFSGWNAFFYCGYPEGVFYPPLAHYLAALLSFALGIDGAIKALICLSFLLLPAAFYYFSRRWGLDTLQSAICATWMTAQLFLCGEMFGTVNFGSDLRSILNVGLFANALSLPVLFFFIGSCGGLQQERRWKLPAFLLGILVLMHPLSALIGGIFWGSLVISQLISDARNKSAWSPLVKVLGIGFLIGSLWAVPFIVRRRFMNPEPIEAFWPLVLQFLILNGIILALSHFKHLRMRPLVIAYILLVNFVVLGGMWQIDLQFVRLTIYILFLIPIFLVSWLRSRFLLFSAGFLAVMVGAYGYLNSGIHPKGVPDFPMPDFGKVQGRILSVAPPSHLPSYHVHHDLIPLRTGNDAILGLFIESSINGRLMGSLTRMIDQDAYVWGTKTEFLKPEVLKNNYAQYVKDRLRLFGITHIYTDLKLEETLDPALAQSKRYINSYPAPTAKNPQEMDFLRKRYNAHGNMVDFYLYSLDAAPVAEAIAYVPKHVTSNWKLTNVIWFSQMRGVPIFTDQEAPAEVRGAVGGEWVEVLHRTPNMERIELEIHAKQPIPVFLKIGYFPNWRLKINGKEARIYRASPDLMLFYGKGHAVLEFRRSWIEYFGVLLSVLGLILIFLL